MGLKEIQRLAHALGIQDAQGMSIVALIHSIQFEEGHLPCFSEAWSAPCGMDVCPFSVACSSNLLVRAAPRH
jgi:hypothetical protein